MMPEEREARILSLEKLVKLVVNLRRQRLPRSIHRDELTSAAWLGAIQAVESFDPERHTSLATYADWKIRSAIADYLRSLDPLGRTHRRRVSAGELPAVVTISADSLYYDSPRGLGLNPLAPVWDPRAAGRQRQTEARLVLHSIYARAALNPRQALIVKRYYNGEELTAIGKSMGIGQSRTSQICTAAVAQLRRAA